MFEKRLKYARIERERRFLLPALPAQIDPGSGYQSIEDRYFSGTSLRLRRVTSPAGEVVELKLNQKLPHEPQLATHRIITSVYLTEADYGLLSRLGGARLAKRRYRFAWRDVRFAVDLFQEALDGLVLAEAEIESDALLESLPALPGRQIEVTADPRFRGAALATEPAARTLALASELLR